MYLCVCDRGIYFASFYDLSVGFLELFRPLPLSMIFLLDYGAVRTVLYLSIGLWSGSDRVVSFFWIMELFGPCCILFCTCISFLYKKHDINKTT